jgi:5-deoxy-glucuronate isomerase
MLGHNVKASRLLAGFTIGTPSAWTSWPPHEHYTSKEEFYLFFDMPKPAFSVQFVYSDVANMEFAEVVQDGDCVTIPGGYHPTAAAPGYKSVFLWVMAGYDPKKDRDFKHGINIQPDYQAVKFL